jgi:D-aspartate ligase
MTADFPAPLALRSRHAVRHYPLADDSPEAFAASLLAATRHCAPEALLPLGTRAVHAAVVHHDAFAAITALAVPPADAFRAAFVKSACMDECRALGIPCPEAHTPHRARALLDCGAGGTLVVKPDQDEGFALGVEYVRTPEELDAAVARCTARYGTVLIQEYVPGGPEAMKTLVVLFGADGRLDAAFTTRKLRQWPPEGGASAASCSTAERQLVDLMRPFFDKWRWRGPAEVEFKLDARDGLHKVIEINPRFPAYLRFPAHCGLDLALLAVRLALGDTAYVPPLFAYRTGAHFVSPTLFLRSLLHDLRHAGTPGATLRAAWRQLDGTGSHVRAMLSDPLPLCARLVSDLARPPARRRRFRIA